MRYFSSCSVEKNKTKNDFFSLLLFSMCEWVCVCAHCCLPSVWENPSAVTFHWIRTPSRARTGHTPSMTHVNQHTGFFGATFKDITTRISFFILSLKKCIRWVISFMEVVDSVQAALFFSGTQWTLMQTWNHNIHVKGSNMPLKMTSLICLIFQDIKKLVLAVVLFYALHVLSRLCCPQLQLSVRRLSVNQCRMQMSLSAKLLFVHSLAKTKLRSCMHV